MFKFYKILLFSIPLGIYALSATAHEGHDHNAPTALVAPKGGNIKSLEKTNVEVVSKGSDIKIYLYDKNLQPQDVKTYTVSAKAVLPRTKKTETITLMPQENYFSATFDVKKIHRYTLFLTIKDPKTGHDDQLQFTIEPRK